MAATPTKQRAVVIAIDDSEKSTVALKWALNNIIKPDDKVHLLHAQPYPKIYAAPAPGFYVPPEVVDNMKKHEEDVSRSVLKAAKEVCDTYKLQSEADIINGEPGDAICDAVEQLKADLLVIGSHGYGALKRAFLGSVSDYCVHHAGCPVVVVRLDTLKDEGA